MNLKPFSTYNLSEILNWLNQIDLQRYSSNFSSMSICGYDLCYLTNSDFSSLGINNLHDKNILIQNIREKTLEQLKLNFNFNKKNVLIQLDFDSNYTIKDLENFLKDIFNINKEEKIFIICKNGKEILTPNLKIVDLILLNPLKYKNLIIVKDINNIMFNELNDIGIYNNNNNNENRKRENKKCIRNLSNPNFNSSTFDLNSKLNSEGSRNDIFYKNNNNNELKKENNNKINNTTNYYDKNINYERPKINTNEMINSNNIIYNLKANVDVFKNYNKYSSTNHNHNNNINHHNNTFNNTLKMNNSMNNLKKLNKENNINYNNLNYHINNNNNNNNIINKN